ncbi:MAG: MarR family winged helix-turn-helix transcriptional regulator, partial [Sciscionella sp.]
SRMITVLVDSGFVRRTPDPQDGRASLVAATAEGERVVSGTRSDRMRELARRIDSLTVEQRIALAQALPALEALVLEDTQA